MRLAAARGAVWVCGGRPECIAALGSGDFLRLLSSDPALAEGAAEAARQEARRAAEDAYVKLARYSLETFVKTRQRAALPEALLPELTARRAGVFVSLKKDGQLRGCIGTFQPTTDHVAAEILQNAVSAGVEDPRFSPVMPEELAELVYSVDVLTDPEPVASEAALDAAKYGVIVEGMGGRRGCSSPRCRGSIP